MSKQLSLFSYLGGKKKVVRNLENTNTVVDKVDVNNSNEGNKNNNNDMCMTAEKIASWPRIYVLGYFKRNGMFYTVNLTCHFHF